MTNDDLKALRGIVASVCTTGLVESEFLTHLGEMRSWCDRNGFHNVEWRIFDAKLVEAGRDEVCTHALSEKYDWMLQIDADATEFNPDLLLQLLNTAYNLAPDSDAVGAYCQLKGGMFLPTIDTGSGTWEPHFPQSGIMPVIRTGGHCLMVK